MSFDLAQAGIALCGITAVFLTQAKRESWRRSACLFGIAGQPFWFWTTIEHQQWGIFMLCFVYAAIWAKGVWQWWIVPWLKR